MLISGVIYAIVHTASDRTYIGSTTLKPSVRFNGHIALLRRGVHTNRFLQASWNKYGAEAFACEIVEAVPDANDLIAAEQRHLDQRRPNVFNIGFVVDRAALGVQRTDEFKAKISAAHRGMKRPPHVGERTRACNATRIVSAAQLNALKVQRDKPMSAEHRRRIGASQVGKVISAETRAKISAAKLGKPGHPMSPENKEKLRIAKLAYTYTPEARAKMSAAALGNKIWLGRKHSPEAIAKIRAARARRCERVSA